MPTIVDITKATINEAMESETKDIGTMDVFRSGAIRPRRPLHRKWSCDFNTFSHPNLQRDVALMQISLEQLQSQYHNQRLNNFQQQKFFGESVKSMDSLKYPISMIGTEDESKLKTTQSSLKKEKNRCNRFGLKFMNGLDEYCDTTTLHGLKYVGDSNLGYFERSFWFVSFVGAVCFATYFIASLYEKFNTSPMVISFSPNMAFLSDIPFPAITICNVNLALKSKAIAILNGNSTVRKQMLSDTCNTKLTGNRSGDYVPHEDSRKWEVVKEFTINVNQNCDDLVKVCKWNGTIKECDKLINSVLTDEGYCCSFNRLPTNLSLRAEVNDSGYFPPNILNWNAEDGYGNTPLHYYPYRSEGQGQSLGLTLVLDAQLYEYHCTSTNSIGFKVLFSTPTESPKIAEIGFLLSPGQETRISIMPDIKDATKGVKNIHINKRQCFFARERHLKFYLIYTEKNCRLECASNFTFEQCGCVPYYLPKSAGTPVCDKSNEDCSNNALDIIERFTTERLSCDCFPSCYDIFYKQDTVSVGKIRSTLPTVNAEFLQNHSLEYFATNMAVVHFYFDVDKFTKQTKSEMYGFSEFLSNTGGLLGLFMGFSFLSAVEIIYFIFFRGTCKYLRNQKTRKIRADKRWADLPYNN